MEHFLLRLMNCDRTFTVRYKELGWNIYCSVQGTGMEHLPLGVRNFDGRVTLRYKELGWNISCYV